MARPEHERMTKRATSNRIWQRSRPTEAELEGRSGLLVAALVAIVFSCGAGLMAILENGGSPATIGVYLVLSLVFLVLSQLPGTSWPFACWLVELVWPFLLLMGVLALALQTISADPFLQPIAFTVPFVFAALNYSAARTFAVGALYIGLMVLGLLLGGERLPEAILYPAAAYGSCMGLMAAFTQLGKRQTEARLRADELAITLERERDQLARLARITATLGSDIDLQAVVEQVARNGRDLAGATSARVWLLEGDTQRLAAVSPAEHEQTLDAAQTPPDHIGQTTGELVLPLVWKGERIGLLQLAAGSDDRNGQFEGPPALPDRPEAPSGRPEPVVLRPFADAAAAAIQNARLFKQAGHSATLAERNRLARELHDTIAQGLTALSMQLEAAQRAFDRDPERAKARLARASELARETLGDVRRSVWTLAAPLEDGQALVAALDQTARRFADRSGVPARYGHAGGEPALDHGIATQVLRVVGEALANVEKHAGASCVEVGSQLDGASLRVWVRDDGAGFDPQAPAASAAGGGFGLFSLRERARLAGGTLRIDSRPGLGTTVELQIAAGGGEPQATLPPNGTAEQHRSGSPSVQNR